MKIDKETGLKPCPMCGSKAIIEEHYDGSVKIRCSNIAYCSIQQELWDDEEDAIAAWNRRYDSDEDDGR